MLNKITYLLFICSKRCSLRVGIKSNFYAKVQPALMRLLNLFKLIVGCGLQSAAGRVREHRTPIQLTYARSAAGGWMPPRRNKKS